MDAAMIRQIVAEEVAKYNEVFLSVDEAMELLRSTSKKNFYEQSKRFNRYKPLGRILFKKSEILNYIESQKVGAIEPESVPLSITNSDRLKFTPRNSRR